MVKANERGQTDMSVEMFTLKSSILPDVVALACLMTYARARNAYTGEFKNDKMHR